MIDAYDKEKIYVCVWHFNRVDSTAEMGGVYISNITYSDTYTCVLVPRIIIIYVCVCVCLYIHWHMFANHLTTLISPWTVSSTQEFVTKVSTVNSGKHGS